MCLRPATFGDLKLLQHWHTKPHVRAVIGDFADVDWQAELAHSPDWRDLLVAKNAGRAIGLVQIIDPAREEAHYWGEASTGSSATSGGSDQVSAQER